MSDIKIAKDMKIVDVMVAQAKGERLDSNVIENANNVIRELAQDMSPNNRYQIAQLVGFTVNELMKPKTNWLDQVADVKRVAINERPQFTVRQDGVKAYVQAKGATTARSTVADKAITLDTLAVSARPYVNLTELHANPGKMAELITEATTQMELAEYGHIQKVLNAAASNWKAPYYGTGSGIVKATLDPMIRHHVRISGGAPATIIGDIDMTSKLAEQTGFTHNGTMQQFSDSVILEQNNAGMIGTYLGAKVVNLINPPVNGTDETAFDCNKLFILPGGIDAGMRPLKVVFEGDIQSIDATHIDDRTFEIRLDQFFNAGVVVGNRPYMSVYEDSSI